MARRLGGTSFGIAILAIGALTVPTVAPVALARVPGTAEFAATNDPGEVERDRLLVARVQRNLDRLGLYRGPLDGRAGPDLTAAIRRYQSRVGLATDGALSYGLLAGTDAALTESRRLVSALSSVRHERIIDAYRLIAGGETVLLPPRGGALGGLSVCDRTPSVACLIDGALDAARRIDDGAMRDWAYGDVAIAQAASGRTGAALATAARLRDPRVLVATLGRLVAAAAEAGDHATARATAAAIPDPDIRIEALTRVAAAAFAAGARASGRSTLIEATVAVAEIDDAARRAMLLAAIAATEAKAGENGAAMKSINVAIEQLRDVANGPRRTRALAHVATVLAESGRLRAALRMADRLPSRSSGTPALVLAAVAEAALGELGRALDRAGGIDDPRIRVVALTRIALVQGKRDPAAARPTLVEARLVAMGIGADYARAQALDRIARAQAALGAVDGALETAIDIADDDIRARALAVIGVTQARAGDTLAARATIGAAMRAVDRVRDPLQRVWLLSDLALAGIEDGGHVRLIERAAEEAAAIGTAWARARALSRVALVLARVQGRQPAP